MKAGKCHEKLSGSTICWLTESFPCKRGSRLTSAPHRPTAEFRSASPRLCHSPFGDRRPCWTRRAEGKSQGLRLAAVSRTAAREGESPSPTVSWGKLEVEEEIRERGALNSSYFGTTSCCQEVSKGWCGLRGMPGVLGAVAGASLVQNSRVRRSAIIWQMMVHTIRDVLHRLQWRSTASKSKSANCVIWNKSWGYNTYQGPYMIQDFCIELLLSKLLQTTWKAVWCLDWWWWWLK